MSMALRLTLDVDEAVLDFGGVSGGGPADGRVDRQLLNGLRLAEVYRVPVDRRVEALVVAVLPM